MRMTRFPACGVQGQRLPPVRVRGSSHRRCLWIPAAGMRAVPGTAGHRLPSCAAAPHPACMRTDIRLCSPTLQGAALLFAVAAAFAVALA